MPERFTEPTCVVCGCTEDRACPPTATLPPCRWVALRGNAGACDRCVVNAQEALQVIRHYELADHEGAVGARATRLLAAARKRRGLAA